MQVPQHPLVTVTSDHELRQLVIAARESHQQLPPIGLLGGDLMRTLGGTAEISRFSAGEAIPHLPIDIVRVVADGERETWFVAHLVARNSWWRGRLVAAMNAQFRGHWDVSPRCHPNDGKVDIVSVSSDMGLQQRWIARSRVSLGTHVPHPQITISQRAATTIDFERRMRLYVDGYTWGSGRRIELSVLADAVIVCV